MTIFMKNENMETKCKLNSMPNLPSRNKHMAIRPKKTNKKSIITLSIEALSLFLRFLIFLSPIFRDCLRNQDSLFNSLQISFITTDMLQVASICVCYWSGFKFGSSSLSSVSEFIFVKPFYLLFQRQKNRWVLTRLLFPKFETSIALNLVPNLPRVTSRVSERL